jgi:hypothetical protein
MIRAATCRTGLRMPASASATQPEMCIVIDFAYNLSDQEVIE